MPAHMVKTNRHRQAAALVIALGVGVVAFGFLGNGTKDHDGEDATAASTTTGPTVLGVVITPELPVAAAATPVALSVERATTPTTRRATPSPTTTVPPSSSTSTPATLVPPTSLENTTTTSPPPTFLETTTTTEPTTTTSVPPG